MTVASAVNRKTFAGDDATTSFATTPVKFFQTSDLQVYVTNDATGVATLLTEDTHYTVSGGDTAVGATGTVSLAGGSSPHGALLSGTTLVVVRELDILQGADFVNNDASNAEVAEAALDKLVMNVQRLDDRLDRSLVISDGDVSGADFTVPTPEASALIGWASSGLSLVNYGLTDLTVSAVPTYALDIITAADDDAFFATMVDGMTAEAAPAVGDLIALVDVSLTPDDGRKMTLENMLKVVNGLTADATPDRAADYLLTYDADAAAAKKVLLNVAVPFATQAEADAGTVVKALTADLNKISLGTPIATTSGTAHDFTGIPSGTRKITLSLTGVSTNGTSPLLLQIGDSGGIEASGYNGAVSQLVSGVGVTVTNPTTGFGVTGATAEGLAVHGRVELTLLDASTFTWACSTSIGVTGATQSHSGGGSKSLSAELTQIRFTTVNGSDTFDAGSVNISYER